MNKNQITTKPTGGARPAHLHIQLKNAATAGAHACGRALKLTMRGTIKPCACPICTSARVTTKDRRDRRAANISANSAPAGGARPANLKQAVLHYTDLTGNRRAKVFADSTEEAAVARLNAALAKCKAANPTHDMAEVVEVVPVAPPSPMSRAQYRSEMAKEAYFRRTAPNCGRALGYDC